MSTEQNKALSRRLIEEVFNQGNLSLVDELFAPDFGQVFEICKSLQFEKRLSNILRGPTCRNLARQPNSCGFKCLLRSRGAQSVPSYRRGTPSASQRHEFPTTYSRAQILEHLGISNSREEHQAPS